MKPYYQDDYVTLYHGDCIETMRGMPRESVDAIVTDPPYGLSFMSAKWDATPPGVKWAEACYRVLKPGGHLLAFGGTRTWHRLAVAIEDAGFEMRDSLAWLYGSGFPKSHDVSKAIDKMAGAEREVIGANPNHRAVSGVAYEGVYAGGNTGSSTLTAPATPEAQQWDGWGTALKPAFEPIVLARKPLAEKTVARNVLEHGTGAINVNACRIETDEKLQGSTVQNDIRGGNYGSGHKAGAGIPAYTQNPSGRWPANVLLDEHMAGVLDEQSGTLKSPKTYTRTADAENLHAYGAGMGRVKAGDEATNYGNQGGASRFFYCAKAGKSERPVVDGVAHATVKPLKLMRYLVRMVTPPGGTILEPFAGSGTTIEAALIEGYKVIGIEQEAEYLPLIQCRVNRVTI